MENTNDPKTMEGLIRLYRPDFSWDKEKSSFKINTSYFRNCNHCTIIGVSDKSDLDQLNFDYKNDYKKLLNRAESFSHNFIDSNEKKKFFIRSMLAIIESDTSISNEATFIISNDSIPVQKYEMLQSDEFYFPAFILSIWYFILNERTDNTIGQNTHNYLYEKKGGNYTKSVLTHNIGDPNRRIILVDEVANNHKRNNNVNIRICDDSPRMGLDSLFERNLDEERDPYYKSAYNKYYQHKTLLYLNKPIDFYSFYVCNDLIHKPAGNPKPFVISNASIYSIKSISNYVIITGTAGLGKSMMLRHLLLNTLSEDPKTIPIFIPIKDFDPNVSYISYSKDELQEDHKRNHLEDFIFSIYRNLNGIMDYETFKKQLRRGNFALLFDGLDEIKSAMQSYFKDELEKLIDVYPENTFVISSRPFDRFLSYSRFSIFDLAPLSIKQADELIEKLEFRPDEPSIKNQFRKELSEKLYYTHKSFCENPLLLTIMLLTYEHFAEIPSKMHLFYHEAYLTLSMRHDATKGLKRCLETGLNPYELEELISEFCARTYYEEHFYFSEHTINLYFNSLNLIKHKIYKTKASDFIYDLVNNICILYSEGANYSFTHRSFQEYFFALYLANLKDSNLAKSVELFHRFKIDSDKAFDILYDMKPQRIEEFIFLTFLEDLFLNNIHSYNEYLLAFYKNIRILEGDIPVEYDGRPSSFLLAKICEKEGLLHDTYEYSFPHYDFLNGIEYCYVDENWNLDEVSLQAMDTTIKDEFAPESDSIVIKDYIPDYYSSYFGTPVHAGWYHILDTKEVFENPSKMQPIIDVLNEDSFPLKQEYINVKKYYNDLKDKYKEKESSVYIFDDFV